MSNENELPRLAGRTPFSIYTLLGRCLAAPTEDGMHKYKDQYLRDLKQLADKVEAEFNAIIATKP